jgi:hypothetical protein
MKSAHFGVQETFPMTSSTRMIAVAAVAGSLAAPTAAQYPSSYNSSDRLAVSQCASAAMAEAARDYRAYNPYGQPYGMPYNYNSPYNAYPGLRVTAITDVERRSDGLRVCGEIDTGRYANIYPNQGITRPGDLTFRCTVDYRGVVTNVRARPNTAYRRY